MLATMISSWVGIAGRSPADELSFNRDIRPILSEHCFACHGPDANAREAELRLDDRDAAIDHGALVPGSTETSPLVERILSTDPDLVMPPPDEGRMLTSEQKNLLVEWIRQGAPYQKHWSFEQIPETVSIPDAGSGWARNPVDAFVAAAHQKKGLQPAPEADRSTWLRRVTFDLTGLPPTGEELDEFLADQSSTAFEKVVDRLLKSPAYGERMAAMWMDVARYADTFGYQNDVPMEVWPWRDWVIGAFNRNLPYDQFLTEQVAGDLLPGATQDQHLATTFNRLHRQTNEGGSIPEEFRIAGIADRTTTAGTAFLGLTLDCCRCHDHKFDPLKQRDFYRLADYFSDIDEFGLYSHFTSSQPTPAMLLYQDSQKEEHFKAMADLREAEQQFVAAEQAVRERLLQDPGSLISSLPAVPAPASHLPLEGTIEGVADKATVCDGDREIPCGDVPEFGRTSPFSISLWVKPAMQQPRMLVLHQCVAAEDAGFRGLQLTIDDGHPEFSMIHFWPGNAVRIRTRDMIPVNAWSQLTVTHDGSGRADGLRLFIDGRAADVDVIRDCLTRDIRHRSEWGDARAGNVRLTLGARFRDVGFRDGAVDELNVFQRRLSSAEVQALYQAVRPDASATVSQAMAVDHALVTDDSLQPAREQLQRARDRENEVVTGIRQIMVMQHSPHASPTHVLHRGDYGSPAEEVTAGTPDLFGTLPVEGEGRLELARWMTHPRNPLTSRVIANRMWHLFWGRGIVVTLEDFGSQGTPPSHPELLDYLARYLMDNNWDLHALCRRIVLSATYRQSSSVTNPALYGQDPTNTWLARGPRHRLSAEQLRDAVLSASGLLVTTIGGPSVMPYQPAGLWEEAGTGKSYHQSTGDGLYRRSLYTFWKRTSPPPSMLTFDATSRESCTPRRELTTTPLQALVFLNDPQYVEAARVLAEQLLKNSAEDADQRWNELFRRLVSRLPSDREREILQQLYQEQIRYFSEDPERSKEFLQVGTRPVAEGLNPADLAAATVVVQTMFSYDETIMLR
ncbi:MAG: DUF1553 domain-containing protein [Planctomycetaceae bacterium]|nr:DUF1553 domain-containing protein [Planctomycetaceae bacterium]